MIRWIRSRLLLRRKLSAVEARIASLERDRRGTVKSLSDLRKALERSRRDAERVLEGIDSRLGEITEESRHLEKRYAKELEIARDEVVAAQQATKALGAQNSFLIEHWKAETAVQIRRQAAGRSE